MRFTLASLAFVAGTFAGTQVFSDTKVECAVNLAKGSITNSEITVQCGLTEAQVAEIRAGQEKLQETADEILAKTNETNALVKAFSAQTAELQRLKDAGVTEAALIELARRISADVDDPAQAFLELQNAVEIAVQVQNEDQRPSNLGDFVDEVLKRAAALSATGNFDEAAASIDAALAQEEADSMARRLRLLDAGIAQDMLRRDPESVANRILRKIELQSSDPATHFDQLRAVQDEYYVRGRDMGLNLDLAVSIHLARHRLALARDADQRGAALNDLAISLAELGGRETDPARLEEAVAAYRAALEEGTRERVPLNWATTQNNLGAALHTLGEREGSTERLEQAVAAYRAALEEWTRERVPLDWSMAQNNLGNALSTLGEREGSTERLEQAVAAFHAAPEERTRERVPLEWAFSQFNLSFVEIAFFDLTQDTTHLDRAEAYVTATREVFSQSGADHYIAQADDQLAEIARRR